MITNPPNLYNLEYLDEGNNTITVRAYDIAGNYCDVTQYIFIDTMPPRLVHKAILTANAEENIVFNITVKDYQSGVKRAELYYAKANQNNYYYIIMEEKDGNFHAVIPGEFVTENINYFIMVMDNSNPPNIVYFDRWGEGYSSSYEPRHIQVIFPDEDDLVEDNHKTENVSNENSPLTPITPKEDNNEVILKKIQRSSIFFIVGALAALVSILWMIFIRRNSLMYLAFTEGVEEVLKEKQKDRKPEPKTFIPDFIPITNDYVYSPEFSEDRPYIKQPPPPPKWLPLNYLLKEKKTMIKFR